MTPLGVLDSSVFINKATVSYRRLTCSHVLIVCGYLSKYANVTWYSVWRGINNSLFQHISRHIERLSVMQAMCDPTDWPFAMAHHIGAGMLWKDYDANAGFRPCIIWIISNAHACRFIIILRSLGLTLKPTTHKHTREKKNSCVQTGIKERNGIVRCLSASSSYEIPSC